MVPPDPGVVHDHVEPVHTRRDLVDQRRHCSGVRYVRGNCAMSVSVEARQGLIGRIGILPVVNRDPGARQREQACRGTADASRCSRDQHDLVR